MWIQIFLLNNYFHVDSDISLAVSTRMPYCPSKSDNKAFLLIRLKKYLNPHENSCSKVLSILFTGNILHESSSAPQQHKSVQYKWFALYLHRDVSHKNMLQPHFISCRGVSGGGGGEPTCTDPGIFVSFIKSSAYLTV